MAHSEAINQRTTDIYFVEAQGVGPDVGEGALLIYIKTHLGLKMKNIQINGVG